ncbi:MAG: hypothetical protein C5B59_01425 [Bacteroidetes bacterium]|nr:MAG: hypothetical protein C5B59_01425 [Bacteroidota bacterium]
MHRRGGGDRRVSALFILGGQESMSEKSEKHFNSGHVFGKPTEMKEDTSTGGAPYLQITMDVSGGKSGRVTAYCRMWGQQRYQPLLDDFRNNPGGDYVLRGFISQYSKDENTFNNFTVFEFERKSSERRAVFILKGEVSHQPSALNDGGQRFLLKVVRPGTNGQEQEETFELWAQGEKLLEKVAKGDLVEVKGMVRQAEPDDFFGGSDGPVRAFVEKLRVVVSAAP